MCIYIFQIHLFLRTHIYIYMRSTNLHLRTLIYVLCHTSHFWLIQPLYYRRHACVRVRLYSCVCVCVYVNKYACVYVFTFTTHMYVKRKKEKERERKKDRERERERERERVDWERAHVVEGREQEITQRWGRKKQKKLPRNLHYRDLYVRHDLFICETWLIRVKCYIDCHKISTSGTCTWEMIHSCVRHDSSMLTMPRRCWWRFCLLL